MNAIDLLKAQHEKVTQALEAVHEDGADAGQIEMIANELVAHMVIEEHPFYPRIRELMPEMIGESFEEHAVARFELARLITAHAADVKTRALVLKKLLEHHIEEEEEEMFTKVSRSLDATELTDLGVNMKIAFDSAVAKGYAAFVSAKPGAKTKRPVRHDGTHGTHAAH